MTPSVRQRRLDQARRLARSPLASRTAVATGFQLLRLTLQVAFLILLARALVPELYGVFVGASSLATAAAGLSGLGTGMLLVKQVAVSPSVWDAVWRRALRMFTVTGTFLSIAFVASAPALLHIALPVPALLCVGLSELLCLPLVYLGGFAFQAFDRIGWSSALPCVMVACRLAGAGLFVTLDPTRTLPEYMAYHATASVVATAITLWLVKIKLRPHATTRRAPQGSMRESLRFCAGWFTNNALVELDKSLAVRFGSPAVGAAYALAYRLSSALSTPVTSLVLSAQPRLFASAEHARRRLATHMVIVTAICSMIAGSAIFFAAPLLPWVFGAAYAEASSFARMLALLPMAFGMRFVVGSLLVGEGYPGLRAAIEALGCLTLLIAAAVLIPRYGAYGMVGMIMVAETTAAVGGALALAALRYRAVRIRRERPP